MFSFISDFSHYSQVLELAMKSKHNLWIGTADIKDLYISNGKAEKPFLGVLSELIGKGVNVRLIQAKEPWKAFREDFDKYKHWLLDLKEFSVFVSISKSSLSTAKRHISVVPTLQVLGWE